MISQTADNGCSSQACCKGTEHTSQPAPLRDAANITVMSRAAGIETLTVPIYNMLPDSLIIRDGMHKHTDILALWHRGPSLRGGAGPSGRAASPFLACLNRPLPVTLPVHSHACLSALNTYITG